MVGMDSFALLVLFSQYSCKLSLDEKEQQCQDHVNKKVQPQPDKEKREKAVRKTFMSEAF